MSNIKLANNWSHVEYCASAIFSSPLRQTLPGLKNENITNAAVAENEVRATEWEQRI